MEILFYLLAAIILFFAAGVIMLPNPLFCALSLAGAMIGLAFMFFLLDAQFIAAVQLVVYAGAVMVLFVMVLMLFNLGKESETFSGGSVSRFLKLASGFALLGILTGGALQSGREIPAVTANTLNPAQHMQSVQAMATQLFTQYLFAFEVLGLLLLLIAVGVVAVSRIKGGTHAK